VSAVPTTYVAISIAWAVVAAAVVPYLLLRPAPYGRHGRPGFGPVVNARLAWVLMEAPAPLGMLLLFLLGRGTSDGDHVAIVLLGMWLGHYVYRAFVFPWLLPRTARPMPVLVLAAGACFNVVNVYLNGYWLFFLAPPRSLSWLLSPHFVMGAALFLGGLLVHVLADRELRRLRSASPGRDGEAGLGPAEPERGKVWQPSQGFHVNSDYVLPRGSLFRWVSCPNYLGEIVEWSGFALASWSPGGLLFALWTAANLVPRALHHHRWYRAKFPDYPRTRRALVPFVL
jgi:3-oxo-5-alpha-steroid 4-dehydrogenase 1